MTNQQLTAKVDALENVVDRLIDLTVHLQGKLGLAHCASCAQPRERLREAQEQLENLGE